LPFYWSELFTNDLKNSWTYGPRRDLQYGPAGFGGRRCRFDARINQIFIRYSPYVTNVLHNSTGLLFLLLDIYVQE
jgi:hypothetical protein